MKRYMSRQKIPSLNKKKQHEILVTDPEAHAKIKGFHDDKHPERVPMMLDGYGRAIVHDDGIAQEIDDRFGTRSKGGTGEVVVVTTEEPHEQGHNYSFGPPKGGWPQFETKEKEDAETRTEGQSPREEKEEESKEEA